MAPSAGAGWDVAMEMRSDSKALSKTIADPWLELDLVVGSDGEGSCELGPAAVARNTAGISDTLPSGVNSKILDDRDDRK